MSKKIKIPVTTREFNLTDYIEGGEGTIVMKSTTPLIISEARAHANKYAIEKGIHDKPGAIVEEIMESEALNYILLQILSDKSDGTPVTMDILRNFPTKLLTDIVDGMRESSDLPLEESLGDSTKTE